MSVVRVDHLRLLDISQILTAELRNPQLFVDGLESWAQEIESNEALKTLDDLDYATRIREVKARFAENLDDLGKIATVMGQVAETYAKCDEWASRLLTDSKEHLLLFIDPTLGDKVVYAESSRNGGEYTVINTKYFRYKIHGYNYKVEGNLGVGTSGYNVESDSHVVVSGPAAGGVIELGTEDNNIRIAYDASGPSAELRGDAHLGDKGGGGTVGAQGQLWNAALSAGATIDGQIVEVTASSGKSKGSVVTEDVNLAEQTASFGADTGKLGIQISTRPKNK